MQEITKVEAAMGERGAKAAAIVSCDGAVWTQLLRGGRLIRWKGEIASCAPSAAEAIGRISIRALSLSLAIGLSIGQAAAADWYWDPNGTIVGRGGAGTWSTAGSAWSPSGDGASGPYSGWNNGALDNAIFGSTVGTVTLAGPITARNLTFETNGYVLTGNTLTLAGVTPTITTNTGTTTISSVVAGSNGLTKTGAGVLLLSGANVFSGGIYLNGGTLNVANDAALGAVSNNIFTAAGVSVGLAVGSAVTNRTVTIGDGGLLNLAGANAGSALIKGNGRVSVGIGVTMSNDASAYTGSTTFNGVNGVAYSYFTSIGNLGEASSLGAPVTVSDGTIIFNQSSQYSDNVIYLGDGDSSNRNWALYGGAALVRNRGTGSLSITGDVFTSGGSGFYAEDADMELLGVLSGGDYSFNGNAGRAISLGGANTYTGATGINGVVVRGSSLADAGLASSLGAGVGAITINTNGALSYTGAGDSSNRAWSIGSGSLLNDGSGALTLSGAVDFIVGGTSGFTVGGSFGGENTLSGVISGKGSLISDGAGTWVLDGANTREGGITIKNGTLRAGNASALGTTTDVTVNGGTLDLGGFDTHVTSLAGTGGSVVLSAGALTVEGKTNTSFAGSITGSGEFIKRGTGALTLSGSNTYTGATTLNGGTLALDFSTAGAPVGNILSSASTLNLAGGVLNVIGADSGANSQVFNGVNLTAGSNKVSAASGTDGSMTLNLGGINRTSGIIDFFLPDSGSITTTSTVLGGWAMVNGSDYAKVVGGEITAFTDADYADKDDAANWLSGDIVSDAGGATNTAYFGTVGNSQTLGGLKYTAASDSTVTIGAGQTLGVDGMIIIASSVGSANQTLNGSGALTGGAGGSTFGVQHNGTGIFSVNAAIIDNGGPTGFTKGGSGQVILSGNNSYSGATTLSGGTLTINTVGNGGTGSAIGASSAAASNLVLESGTLRYTGATTSSDRGFTLINGGPTRTIQVESSGANLTFSGQVTSPDDAGFSKIGSGTLTLSNAGNDYVGTTTVNGGTLAVSTLADGGQVSSIGMSGSDAANLVLAGGTLDYLGGTASSDRGFTLGGNGTGYGGIGVADAAGTLTLGGSAIGNGLLRKEGAGTLVLSGANTYAGGTTINGGTLRAGSTQAFGSTASPMTINTGGRLELGGFDAQASMIAGAGTVDLGGKTLVTAGGSGVFTGTVTGTGGFTRGTGSYTQTMNGCNNDYTGVTTLSGGLSVDCLADGGQASGIGASSNASANLVFTGGGLAYTGASVSTDRGFTLTGQGTVGVNDANTTLEFTGAVVGAGNLLRKDGAGTLVLSGVNTYTGNTQVLRGTLRAGSAQAFGPSGGMSLDNVAGVTLDLAGYDASFNYLQGGGTAGGIVQLNGADLTITNGNNAEYAGILSGVGSLIKSGAGLQRLTGCSNDYTGPTTVNGGVLEVSCLGDGGVASSIGVSSADPSNLIINGGTLRYAGTGDSTDRRFTLGASGGNALDASGIGAIHFTSTAPVTFSAAETAQTLTLTGTSTANNMLAAQLTNNGSGKTALTKTGVGTWILTNPGSTYTGVTTISGGVLGVDKLANGGLVSSLGASSADASNLIIGNGSTLRYTGTGDSTDRLFTLSSGVTYIESSGTGAVVFTDTGPVTLAGNNQARTIALGGSNTGNNTLAGSIGDAGTGKTILAKNDAGTWLLTGNHTYTGNTVVNDGTLVIGNNGNTGSIISDVIVAGGALAFNRGDTYRYGGAISGAGGISQIGSGTTLLTGSNSYTGTTHVNAGTLLVDGDQSAATGQVTVLAAGTLGGSGIIGGDVSVAGGTLTPGGSDVGTLTINGALSLDANSTLAMQFGQANTVGGTFNDLIEVKGNLVLDGTLEVSETTGGAFGPGLYRVISYSGNLTDNGLDLGPLPSGNGLIQTSVAGQINLLAGGDNFSFWDGDAGPKFNQIVNGGNGTWQASTGNDNWTEASGLFNAAYSDGTFAIFAGAAGTVSVDNALGAVSASGMQFATNGYVINGNPVTLVGPQSTLRVGDGTAAGGAMMATINAQLTGTTELVKSDAGTLVLSGNNLYTGGTAINGGTLQIAADTNLGAAAGGLSLNGGTLRTTADITSARAVTLVGAGTLLTDAGTDLLLTGPVAGVGALTKSGPGTLLLTGNATHSGGTTIDTGMLQVGNGGTTGSIAGNIANNGALVFNRTNALTHAGAVSGTGTLTQAGSGAVTMTGVSTYTGATAIDAGLLLLNAGGQINGTSGLTVRGGAAMSLDGAGSRLLAGPGNSVIGNSAGTAAMTVSNGGIASVAGFEMAAVAGSNAVLRVADAGTQLSITGPGHFGVRDLATIEVINSGKMTSAGVTMLGDTLPAGRAEVSVSGAGSRWDIANALQFQGGTMAVSNGGVVTAATTDIGAASAELTVSGNGSRFESDGAFVIANTSGMGVVTIADGGVVKAGNGTLAMGTGDAVLNIGGVEGGAATAAGTLEAAAVTFAVAGNRINFNHTDIGHGFTAAISGAGWVDHNGPGATVLSGFNSYKGATNVNAGSLYINGDQSAATGLTTVNSGATLGGTGTIGGNVDVLNGGAINPGGLGAAPAALSLNGNLNLAAGATLNFNLGQANVPGGPLNDVINVGGNLTLDGNLTVVTSPGGSFDPGVYRVINYAGTLTDNGLLANVPSPDFYVQTSVDQQVNLVNTAGMALRYWDGADVASKNNGGIDGGNGSWQAFGVAPDNGNDNWTEDGAVNAPFADAAFAVFMGAAGTVSVDDSKGAVNAAGMQFVTDGYVINGDDINLVGGPTSVIRVGDGTAGGASTFATIDSVLTGGAQLVKSDMGTLVLSGDNRYIGGTAINGGTLQIATDGNLGDAAGALSFNGGTLRTTADLATGRQVSLTGSGTFNTDAGTQLTLDAAITGAGTLGKDGAGTLLLLGDAASTGGVTITHGTLQLGNGGTAGSVMGDIANDGLLLANRSNGLTLNGVISGNGAFTQAGSGSTTLSGHNTYAGATQVDDGMLRINGDQTAATGATTVASGAALGGAGIIGGDVVIADGARLEPGSAAGAVSTLNINGALSLGSDATLDMQFGEAYVEGGAYNDLVNVGGDLTLDGRLDVSVSPGGVFGAGIYRVINYGGALTNNGLTLGNQPADSELFVQTSVSGQVNLVNGAGLTLNYWDGTTGPAFDHNIAGGDGLWQNHLGNNYWTDAAGDINAAYTNGAFAIFTGAAGTVTIDNSLGQVAASGMQFAVNGYRIEGGVLALMGPQSTIRVGDGTADGAGMAATITSNLIGTGGLLKDDLGTLILSGNNSYGGGTVINGGTLQVAADTALGAASGALSFDGGTLHTTADMGNERTLAFAGKGTLRTDIGTALTLGGVLSGSGAFSKTGEGTLVLNGSGAGYTGAGSVDAGTLAVSSVLGGSLAVGTLGRLEGSGQVGATNNAGVISPGSAEAMGTLTIQGNYAGNDGRLQVAAVLGDDNSAASRLVVNGATLGSTQVEVSNRGGLGAQTVEGIKIIEVNGVSHGSFALHGDYVFNGEQAVVAGAYGYRLYQGGVATPTDGDWYLRSALLEPGTDTDEEPAPLYQPGVPLYESHSATLQAFDKFGTLQQRTGDRLWSAHADGTMEESHGALVRVEGSRTEFKPKVSTSNARHHADTWKLQVGVDAMLAEYGSGTLVGGAFAQYGTISSRVRSPYGVGDIETDARGLSAAMTWYGKSGFYVDGQMQFTMYDSDMRSATAARDLATDVGGQGYGLSLEIGRRIALSGNWSLTPQGQLAYSVLGFDPFDDAFDARISLGSSYSVLSRAGLAANYDVERLVADGTLRRTHLYGIANVYYDSANAAAANVSGVDFTAKNERLYGGIGMGGSLSWGGDKYSLYGEVQYKSSLEASERVQSLTGTVGFSLHW